ncbi:MAG TPA: peptidoglycan DD-metalloendopeptidase family protein [Bacteroidales bacterium]|nr:MAG: Murein DD-endopeptidase MepM [Bacteroidetes bacterium ADurb.Bin037]HPV87717.1 peptidoglycan DD-metalloendopeptidase family protein [Bacteroidales bacterium]HPW78196.1 peptidoglycan DD-metalloendopeptidase family protein [Bacteroidales bacterium]HQB55798.1 peptidoglycan DD-metalloendopeptidase family protein [Bacteroidales bacterium]
MKKHVFILLIFSTIILACTNRQKEREKPSETSVEIVRDERIDAFCCLFGLPSIDYEFENDVVKRNEHFAAILQRRGVDYQLIYNVSQKARNVFDLRKLKAGNTYTLLFTPGAELPDYMIYEENYRTHICFSLTDSIWVTRSEFPLQEEEKFVDITITSSLWQDLKEAGYNPLVANGLSEIFAWTVDFFGLQKGDSFKACYTAYMLNGKEIEVGPVQAASFSRAGRSQMAYRFVQDSIPGYWDQDGVNLQRAFLKAPLKFSRISSGFSYARRHPVTRIVRPHTGIDYAAPAGTPVMSIGEGVVVQKTYTRAGGNQVKVKHNSVYTTAYLHLSRFAKGLTVGKRVSQGEVIGYVGSTGLSTGPHLDFRVWKNNKPINPLTMESPPADPVHGSNMKQFLSHIAPFRRHLQPELYKEIALEIIDLAGIRFN